MLRPSFVVRTVELLVSLETAMMEAMSAFYTRGLVWGPLAVWSRLAVGALSREVCSAQVGGTGMCNLRR